MNELRAYKMADNRDIYLKLITCEYEEMIKKAIDASSLPKDCGDNDDWDMNVNGDDNSSDEDMDVDMDVEEQEEEKTKIEEVILRYQAIIAKNKR